MTTKAVTQTQDALTPATSENGVISMLNRVMNDPSLPIERVEQAFAFYQKVEADQAKKAWTAAFIKAASKLEQVKREAQSDKGKYASFEAIDAATRPILNDNGFQFTHTTETSAGADYIKIVTYLLHESGHRERYEVDMPADGKGAKGNDVMTKTHAVGSAMTYGKRYNIGNALNIATYKDDDGKAAGIAPVTTRSVIEQIPAEESATKRDEILKALRGYKKPFSPQDQNDFAEKFAAQINELRKADAEAVRDAYAEKKRAK